MPAARRKPAAEKTNGATANKVEVIFDFDRETKGTYRFAEVVDGKERAIMGTIWLRRDIAEQLGVTDEDSGVKITLEADNS
jgi:hypothetical protein